MKNGEEEEKRLKMNIELISEKGIEICSI